MKMQRTIIALALAGCVAGASIAPARRAGARHAAAAAAEMVVLRPVRQVRPGTAPARLQGLPGSLRQTAIRSDAGFPQSGRAGRPGFSEAQAEAVAAEYKVKDLDDQGEPIERPGRLADHFPPPFANELVAKAANGGAAPPDMSTLAKARTYERGFPWFVFDMITQYQEQGPDYIAALLNGYEEPPKGFQLPQGGHYNKYFPGHDIAMPPPLQAGQVTYRRRRAADAGAIFQGRLGLPDVGGRAAHGAAQAHRPPGHDLPDRAGGADVFHQEEGVVGGREAALKSHATGPEKTAA